MARNLKRREFLTASAAFAVYGALGRRVRASSLNGKLRTAHIGVGGMGASDLRSVASHDKVEVAALCDVDINHLNRAKERHPNSITFRDYRELFSSLGDKIDAVVVSTPDHTHAPAAMTALQLGKPVYCQKPLTHDIHEARQLRLVAEEKRLPTQMGIQVHSAIPYRLATQMIQSGTIGKVSRVYAWSQKNWGYDGGPFNQKDEVPENLDWNLWLGTAAVRPFVKDVYHPGNWRKLIDFGTGTLGDMGVHIFDTPYRALELTAPHWAKTACRPPTGIGHPEMNVVEYEFPGTRFTADRLLWTWYDGAFAPPANEGLSLPEGLKLPGQGSLFIGEVGTMLLPHVSDPILFPVEKFKNAAIPKLEHVDHYHQWVDACLGDGSTSADFSYAGPLTEALLLGVVANRFPEKKLLWDADNLTITNIAAANSILKRDYRDEFDVSGLQ